jgi:UDP-N-acetylglucosamine--N-acetylmuramyl-(pentapeptide) pyrophosphoryl-undecaprenol N-acetylglucosamine transferase
VTAPVVLAAGGTGGHLFPAEALAGELLRRGHGVHLLTDVRVDALAGRLPGLDIHRVRAGRLGGGPLHTARGLAALALGTLEARRLLRHLDPAAVVGFGGYVSVPTMLAASHLGVPTAIHEQNAVLGRANRLLAPRVRRIATGFPATAGVRPGDRARLRQTGNPVRAAILAAARDDYKASAPDAPIHLLVLGGSQGARILSEIVPPSLAALPPRIRVRLQVAQQARPEDLNRVRNGYGQCGIAAEVEGFFTDVPERLAATQLAICRAGASTIAELAAVGRPAVLIPYPHATDDHQSANARAFADAGGGWVLPQAGLTAPILAEHLLTLLSEPAALCDAAARARQFGRRDAAELLADLTLELAGDARATECAA